MQMKNLFQRLRKRCPDCIRSGKANQRVLGTAMSIAAIDTRRWQLNYGENILKGDLIKHDDEDGEIDFIITE